MKSWVWLLLAVFSCATTFSYRHRTLLPWEYYVNVERGPLKAQMGDLYPRWVGTRELLLNKRNPYSSEVSHEIQMAFYGHPVDQTYDRPQSEILDEQRFAYPVYVVFLLAPTIHLDFAQVQQWTPVFLGVLVAASVCLWLRVLDWRISGTATTALILVVLSTPQVTQGFRLRQVGFIVFFLLALASWCIVRNCFFMGGVFLAISTIKPQIVVLYCVWLFIWGLGDWKKRWPLAAGFGFAMLALTAGGELLVPGWPRYFVEGVKAYNKYFPTTSPLRLVLGNCIGGTFSIVAIAILLAYAWSKRRVGAKSPDFVELVSLFLLTSLLVLPILTPFNQALLLLPVFVLLRDWSALPKYGRFLFAGLLMWPVVVSGIFLIIPPEVRSLRRTPLLPSALVMLTPFVVCVLTFLRRDSIEFQP